MHHSRQIKLIIFPQNFGFTPYILLGFLYLENDVMCVQLKFMTC